MKSMNIAPIVYESDAKARNGESYMKVRKANEFGRDYYFAERVGKHSVAFILFDGNRHGDHYGLICEFKPPISEFMITAFGGSFDSDISPKQLARQELLEEAGYLDAFIVPLGRRFVSTQMNQYCYLFLMDVTKAEKIARRPENKAEEAAEVLWLTRDEVIGSKDWKAPIILMLWEAYGQK